MNYYSTRTPGTGGILFLLKDSTPAPPSLLCAPGQGSCVWSQALLVPWAQEYLLRRMRDCGPPAPC